MLQVTQNWFENPLPLVLSKSNNTLPLLSRILSSAASYFAL